MVCPVTIPFDTYGSSLTNKLAASSVVNTKYAPVGTSIPGGPHGPPLTHVPSSINFFAKPKCPSRYGPRFSNTSGMYSYFNTYCVAAFNAVVVDDIARRLVTNLVAVVDDEEDDDATNATVDALPTNEQILANPNIVQEIMKIVKILSIVER